MNCTMRLELDYMLEVAHTIILGALLREESRGAHFRRDLMRETIELA